MWDIDIFSKYVWAVTLKDKRITITDAFLKIRNESGLKASKKWIDRRNEFCNRTMKSRLEKNDIQPIEIYSTYLEEKSVVVERFLRTKKNKIYKHLTSISKNVYIDKLSEIVKKYNNAWSLLM